MSCRRRALARVAEVTGFRAAVTLNESCAECVLINYQSNSNYFTCRCPWGAVFREMPDALAVVIMMIKDRGSSADGGPWAEGLGWPVRAGLAEAAREHDDSFRGGDPCNSSIGSAVITSVALALVGALSSFATQSVGLA